MAHKAYMDMENLVSSLRKGSLGANWVDNLLKIQGVLLLFLVLQEKKNYNEKICLCIRKLSANFRTPQIESKLLSETLTMKKNWHLRNPS